MQSQLNATLAWSSVNSVSRIMPALYPLICQMHMEEAGMKYINAKDILPEHLIKTLQEYIPVSYTHLLNENPSKFVSERELLNEKIII